MNTSKNRRHTSGTPESPENFHKKTEHSPATDRSTVADRTAVVDATNAPGMERTLDRSTNMERDPNRQGGQEQLDPTHDDEDDLGRDTDEDTDLDNPSVRGI